MATCVVSTVVFREDGQTPLEGADITAATVVPQATAGGMFGQVVAEDTSGDDGVVELTLARGGTFSVECQALGVGGRLILVPDAPTADLSALLASYQTPEVGPTVALARAESFDTADDLESADRPDGSFAYVVDTATYYERTDGAWTVPDDAPAVAAEAAARLAADNALAASIAAEAIARAAADTANANAIAAEATTRANADTAESAARLAGDGPHFEDVSASRPVLASEHGKTFTNTSASGAVILGLPAGAPLGTRYRMVANNLGAFIFWFQVSGGATVRRGNNVTADGPYYQGLKGAAYEIELIEATAWLITNVEGTAPLDATTGSPL
jgi:hypothetical protein